MADFIMTPDRAARLARAMHRVGHTIHLLEGHPTTGYRVTKGGITVRIYPYARVYWGTRAVSTINYEVIDAEGNPL